MTIQYIEQLADTAVKKTVNKDSLRAIQQELSSQQSHFGIMFTSILKDKHQIIL